MKHLLLLAIILIGIQTYAQDSPMSDPENNAGWILNEDISDEFNGTELDKNKWWILGENGDYRKKWKGRAPGQFVDHNVKVENGELILMSQWEPDFNFLKEKNNDCWYGGTNDAADNSKPITQACIMSETFFKYGYMEIRCKTADAPVTSAFWTTGYHSEIDMIELYGKLPKSNPNNKPEELEKKYRTNLINWDPERASDHKNWKKEDVLDVRVANDYYVYGFEWDPFYIKTYFNGELIRHATREELMENDQWKYDYPQELWLDTEVFYWYGLPSAEDLVEPAEFKIDYVRIWQKRITGPDFNAMGFEGPFHYQGRSAAWWSAGNIPWRIKDDNPACGNFSLRFKKSEPFNGSYIMYGPFGSLNLPNGENTLKFKVWIDPDTEVDEIEFNLKNPAKTLKFDLSNVTKGEWVERSTLFSRNAASSQNLKNGDRLEITLKSSAIKSSDALIYIDDIRFNNYDNSGECPECAEYFDLEAMADTTTNAIIDMQNIDFSIYPNPAKNQIQIESSENGLVRIYNNIGVLIKTVQKNSMLKEIEISDLKKGIYLVQITTTNRIGTQKLIIE